MDRSCRQARNQSTSTPVFISNKEYICLVVDSILLFNMMLLNSFDWFFPSWSVIKGVAVISVFFICVSVLSFCLKTHPSMRVPYLRNITVNGPGNASYFLLDKVKTGNHLNHPFDTLLSPQSDDSLILTNSDLQIRTKLSFMSSWYVLSLIHI